MKHQLAKAQQWALAFQLKMEKEVVFLLEHGSKQCGKNHMKLFPEMAKVL